MDNKKTPSRSLRFSKRKLLGGETLFLKVRINFKSTPNTTGVKRNKIHSAILISGFHFALQREQFRIRLFLPPSTPFLFLHNTLKAPEKEKKLSKRTANYPANSISRTHFFLFNAARRENE
ncbi:hypothetical protein TNIN_160721 [Trichonephila inaurata madagascariensis]|uniref:Uncharacterized protein n=1 Tax=Trichonephila inaurata madagascariensis TaxID=2747483 RepID=A0A8X6XNG4_9ARAC|nr:hypothetical protein TNIN_160721 [Trichonephila inaurata madagascariensis]